MMKLFIAAAAIFLPLSVLAGDIEFKEGKHYEIISETKTEKPEVKEYFSFYCGACYMFEPIVQGMARTLPAGTEFKKSHVDFVRGASPQVQNALARAYVVAKNAGKGDQVATSIFERIHKQRIPFANESELRGLMMLHDINGDVFDKAVRSFAVRGAVNQMATEQKELVQKRVLKGVPMLVVNGKYKIKHEELGQGDMQANVNSIVKYLLEKE